MSFMYEDLSYVENGLNKTMLSAFQIDGLFGHYCVKLDFEKKANIFIGENGLGKTTILRCLYYTLIKDFLRLSEMPFERITVFWSNGNSSAVTRDSILKSSEMHKKFSTLERSPYDSMLRNWLREQGIAERNLLAIPRESLLFLSRDFSSSYDIPMNIAFERLLHFRKKLERSFIVSTSKSDKNSDFNTFQKEIWKNITESIIYLPTYRRIESSPSNFRYEKTSPFHSLIHFDMEDVQESIDAVLSEIKSQTMHGYNNMTGILLKEYSEGETASRVQMKGSIDFQTAEIVLNRLGEEIDDDCKETIRYIFQSKSIDAPQYVYLQNLLQKLIDNYKKLKAYDERIIKFSDTCNRYLTDKHFVYDPSSLTLSIYIANSSEQRVTLSQLSSGEKQIVSLFAMLYLTDIKDQTIQRDLAAKNGRIIMIDEPELSLSIAWQKQLLPDIIRTGNCDLLLAVTHSPFIFENEFDMDAKEIQRIQQNENA